MSRRRACKVMLVLLVALVAALLAGCGSGSGGKKHAAKKAPKDPRMASLEANRKEFHKRPKSLDVCRNLALSYVALASPTSTGKKGATTIEPKHRESDMRKAADTYEKCLKLEPGDVDLQRSTASTWMAVGRHDKAAPLLDKVAHKSNDPNDYYSWGVAASNSGDSAGAIDAWERFLQVAPKDDTRLAQVRTSLKLLREEQKN